MAYVLNNGTEVEAGCRLGNGNVTEVADEDVTTLARICGIVLNCSTIISLTLNILVVAASLYDKRCRKPSCVLLISLALVDICMLIFVNPLASYRMLTGSPPFSSATYCLALKIFHVVSWSLTLLIVSTIAVNKLVLAICSTPKYRAIFSITCCIQLSACSWFLAALTGVFLGMTHKTLFSQNSYCLMDDVGPFCADPSSLSPMLTGQVVIHLVICVCCYTSAMIYNALRDKERKREGRFKPCRQQLLERSIKSLLIATVVFWLTGILPLVVSGLWGMLAIGEGPDIARLVAMVISLSRSMFNPIIYIRRIPEFRRTCRMVVRRSCRKLSRYQTNGPTVRFVDHETLESLKAPPVVKHNKVTPQPSNASTSSRTSKKSNQVAHSSRHSQVGGKLRRSQSFAVYTERKTTVFTMTPRHPCASGSRSHFRFPENNDCPTSLRRNSIESYM